jgi:SAM-dependent methyltransferase
MYSPNPARDLLIFVRATVTNQLARFPAYLKVGNRTGRGDSNQRPEDNAQYFRSCVRDYLDQLGVGADAGAAYLRGKRVLEYGPGDALGAALVFFASGAESVRCVDRFPLHALTANSIALYEALLRGFEGEARERAARAFNEPGNPRSGFNPAAIDYQVTPDGLSGQQGAYDLVVSRSVLALVNRLDQTLADVARALRPDGVSVHKVDLSSHNLDRYRPLDFLTWPEPLYRMMYSRKGRPNRWRADTYRELARRAGLQIRRMEATGRVDPADVAFLQSNAVRPFRDVPADLLSWLGFWVVLEHPRPPGGGA